MFISLGTLTLGAQGEPNQLIITKKYKLYGNKIGPLITELLLQLNELKYL